MTLDGREMLYGAIDREQLYFDYPEWKDIEVQYEPSSDIIEQLKNFNDTISVEIFLGTWCSDSKREVPAFFKIVDQASLDIKFDINIWAVDRDKRLDNGLAQKCNIEFVPTFIFYKADKEIGRIIEMPDGLLEEDVWAILKNVKN